MNGLREKIYSKLQARKRLGVSRARYEQLIESGIMPKPFALVDGARPVHTESQITLAELNLERRALAEYRELENKRRENGYKPIKPITLKPGERIVSRSK